MGHFCPPGSGSADPIESGSNWDQDPQPWMKECTIKITVLVVCMYKKYVNWNTLLNLWTWTKPRFLEISTNQTISWGRRHLCVLSCVRPMEALCQGHLHPLHRAFETEASQSGIEPSCLLDCRRTLYAKSHSNGVIYCYLELRLVLLQPNQTLSWGGRHLCVLSCARPMEALCPQLCPALRRPCSTVACWLPSTSSPPTSCSTELFIRKLSSSSSSCSDDSWEFQRLASMCCCCCWESFMERREAGRSWLKLDGFIWGGF